MKPCLTPPLCLCRTCIECWRSYGQPNLSRCVLCLAHDKSTRMVQLPLFGQVGT